MPGFQFYLRTALWCWQAIRFRLARAARPLPGGMAEQRYSDACLGHALSVYHRPEHQLFIRRRPASGCNRRQPQPRKRAEHQSMVQSCCLRATGFIYFRQSSADDWERSMDWTRNLDFSLFKNFQIKERFQLQFRAEAFNITNTPIFNRPNTTFGSSAFGVVSSQSNVPRQIQLALKLMF